MHHCKDRVRHIGRRTPRCRWPQRLCALFFSLLLLQAPAAEVFGQSCPARFGAVAAPDFDALWQADNLYWVGSSQPTTGKFDVVIVGDVIVLTPKTFPMLARTDNRPISNWSKVTIDARVIVVGMPLIFGSTKVELRAQKIIWKPEGRISLKAPPGDGGDGVQITAQEIDFSKAALRPFDFATDNWEAYPLNDADLAGASRWNRAISMHAAAVTPPDFVHDGRDDMWRWIRNLTQDRSFILRGGRTSQYSRRPYQFEVGAAGAVAYAHSLEREMLWPLAFASHVERAFVQRPYEPDTRAFLVGKLDIGSYLTLLKPIPRHVAAWSKLLAMRSALDAGTDLSGYRAEHVPRVSFETLRDDFSKQLGSSQNLALASIEQSLQDANATTRTAEQARDVETAEARRAPLEQAAADLRNQGNLLIGKIAAERQSYDAEVEELDKFRKLVEVWAKKQGESDERRRQLAVAIQGIGIVGTAIVTIYGSPVAGAAFSQGWATVGTAVNRHQAGRTISNLADAESAVAEGREQGARWSETVGSLRTQWSALDASASNGSTVVQQIEMAAELARSVSTQVERLSAGANVANVASIYDLDPNWKATAEAHRKTMEAINTAIALDETELAGVLSLLQQNLSARSELDGLEAALNAQPPSNSSEVAERQAFYDGVLTSVLSDLTSSYDRLVRAYGYHTLNAGRPLDLAPIRASLIQMSDRQLQALAAGENAAGFRSIDGSKQIAALLHRYDDGLRSMNLAVTEADNRMMATRELQEDWQFTALPDEDRVRKDVIVALNAALSEAFNAIKSSRGSERAASAVVSLPIDEFLDPTVTDFEFVRQLAVSRVGLASELSPDARLELTVIHPGFGELHGIGNCYVADFTEPKAVKNVLEFPSVVGPDGATSSTPGVAANGTYALFPLRARYVLRVSVLRLRADNQFSNWEPPRVTSLTLHVTYQRR